MAEAEFDAQVPRACAEGLREKMAIAGLVAWQPESSGEPVACLGQGRLDAGELVGREQFVGHATFLEHRDVTLHCIELGLGPEQLQRATGALLVGDPGLGAQLLEAASAVLGHTHHAFLVDGITLGRAVAQHLRHPLQLEQTAIESHRQRCVLLEHPFQRLQGNARCRPRRRIAWRHLPGVGEAGLPGRSGLAIEHGDPGAGSSEIVGRADADDAAAEDNDFHG